MTPFLTIITRTYKRPALLRRCIASVLNQTCDDYQFVILYDDEGRGLRGSFEYLASEPEPYTGRYIFCLDDDNELIDTEFVARLRDVGKTEGPDVMMFLANHPDIGDIPRPWGRPPVGGQIDLACYAIKADLWRKHAHLLHSVEYAGDFELINAAYRDSKKTVWIDRVFTRINQVSRGEPEQMFAEWHRALRENAPSLFVGGKRVLYVGANRCAPPVFAAELKKAGNELHLLEIWGPNVKHYQERDTGRFETITQGDVRNPPPDLGAFDAAFWWHGPEHLEADDWPGALAALERIAPLVVVGCPWGVYPQGANDGNENEIHRCAVYPFDLIGCGYEVVTHGEEDELSGNIIAWKGELMAKKKIEDVHIYDGCYVKEPYDRAFWAVDDGKRRLVLFAHQVNADPRPVETISPEQLAAIPMAER